MTDPVELVRAGRAVIPERESPRRRGMVNALGVALIGDPRLAKLVTCSLCGVMGDVGDECGRAPAGHVLTP